MKFRIGLRFRSSSDVNQSTAVEGASYRFTHHFKTDILYLSQWCQQRIPHRDSTHNNTKRIVRVCGISIMNSTTFCHLWLLRIARWLNRDNQDYVVQLHAVGYVLIRYKTERPASLRRTLTKDSLLMPLAMIFNQLQRLKLEFSLVNSSQRYKQYSVYDRTVLGTIGTYSAFHHLPPSLTTVAAS